MKKFIPLLFLIALIATGCQLNFDGVKNEIVTKEFIVGGERVIINEQPEVVKGLFGAKEVFKPEVKLEKWGDETHIRIWSEEEGDDKARQVGDKIVWENKNKSKEYNFYPLEPTDEMENGGFEYEIILKEKPKSNIIELKIELKDLECYYQPELTQEEKDEGIERPENVIGSYAVYHKTKSGDYSKIGGKNYMAGKAFHIYRPRMCDSNGWCEWGQFNSDMNETGILTNTLPQDFLDNAVYPVRHATGLKFGYDTGGTAGGGSADNYVRGSIFTLSDNADVNKMSAYIKKGSDANQKFVCGIYDSSHDLVLNANTGEVDITNATYDWIDFTFSTNPLPIAADYWLITHGEAVSGIGYLAYDAGDTDQGLRKGVAYNPTLPASIAVSHYHSTNKYSIYATYDIATPPPAAERPRTMEVIIIE